MLRQVFHNQGVVYSAPWSLDLDFLTEKFDQRIAFSRPTADTRIGPTGLLETVPAGVPVIDYHPVTLACMGLRVQEQRTNLLLQSSNLHLSPWAGGATATPNAGPSPDGGNNANLVEDTSTTQIQGRTQTVAVTSGSGSYVASIFVQAGTSSVMSLRMVLSGGSTGVSAEAVFRLTDGVAQWRNANVGTAFRVEPAGAGRYCVSVVITDNASGNNQLQTELRPAFAQTLVGTFDSTAMGNVLAWGFQVEPGAFRTSHIPTTTAQATRAADAVTMALSPWFNAAAGTFLLEVERDVLGGTDFQVGQNTSGTARMYHPTNSVTSNAEWRCNASDSIVTGGAQTGRIERSAVFYDTAAAGINFGASHRGAAVVRATRSLPNTATFNTLYLGATGTLTATGRRWIRKFRYYPTRLDSAQLQALTA